MDEPEALYKKLLDEAKTQKQKTKITAIYNACKTIIKNKGSISIKSVVSILNSNGVIISNRSIYNDCGGKNPYRQLVQAWSGLESPITLTKLNGLVQNIKPIDSTSTLTDSEILSIPNDVLRYRIVMLLQELKHLRQEVGFAKQIKNLPEINIYAPENSDSVQYNLSELYFETLNNLIKNSTTNVIDFDEDGCAYAKRTIRSGDKISSPGLFDAIKFIIGNYSKNKISG